MATATTNTLIQMAQSLQNMAMELIKVAFQLSAGTNGNGVAPELTPDAPKKRVRTRKVVAGDGITGYDLRKIRDATNLNQADFGKKLGWKWSKVSYHEAKRPHTIIDDPKVLKAIAEIKEKMGVV